MSNVRIPQLTPAIGLDGREELEIAVPMGTSPETYESRRTTTGAVSAGSTDIAAFPVVLAVPYGFTPSGRVLTGTAGDISVTDGGAGNNITLDLISTGVTPGAYTSPVLTVDAKGRITAIASGTPGTVTSVSVVTANGFAGSVATATTTPAITLSTTITGILTGNGTAISAATTTGTGAVVLSNAPTIVGANLGTPSAINLTNGTNLPISGIAGLGTGVGTWLATPSSANLAAAVTDETGTGALVFAGSPALTGTPTAPTASPGTSTTQLATTAFVGAGIAANVLKFNAGIANLGLSFSVAASALTITLTQSDGSTAPTAASPVSVSMRSATAASGVFNGRTATSTISLTVPATATLGFESGKATGLFIYVIDNSGTLELAVSATDYGDSGIIDFTTTLNTGSDSTWPMYSAVARLNIPYRKIGNAIATEATAGTWATVPATAAVQPELIPYQQLPWVIAAKYGVRGNGTDVTSIVQGIVDNLPATGGNILFPEGDIRTSNLDFGGRPNIKFFGLGGENGGATQRTIWRLTAAGSTNALDFRGCLGCEIHNLQLAGSDASFTGTYIRLGVDGTETVYFAIQDCVLLLPNSGSASANLLDVSGSTQGVYERVVFGGGGAGTHILGLRNDGTNNFSNVQSFRNCNFNPTTQYAVKYPGTLWVFDTCNVQAGTDHRGRFMQGDSTLVFRSLAVRNLGAFDVSDAVTATDWFTNMYGTNFTLEDGQVGGQAATTGVRLYGVQGFRIVGNWAGACADFVNLQLATAVKCTGGIVTANEVVNGNLLANVTNGDGGVMVWNNAHSGTGTNTVQIGMLGMPSSAGQTGSLWYDGADSNRVKYVP